MMHEKTTGVSLKGSFTVDIGNQDEASKLYLVLWLLTYIPWLMMSYDSKISKMFIKFLI